MAVITNISKKAEAALKKLEIRYVYGHGDGYHFLGVPGTSTTDIDTSFTISGINFAIVNSQLKLQSELTRSEVKARSEVVLPEVARVLRAVNFTEAIWHRLDDADYARIGLAVDTAQAVFEKVASELGLTDEQAAFLILETYLTRIV